MVHIQGLEKVLFSGHYPLLYKSCVNVTYIEDITRWLEDMNFMFKWQEQHLHCEGGNCEVIERYDTHKGDIQKICHSGPG